MEDFITIKESFFIAGVSISLVFLVLIVISILIYGLGFIKKEEVEIEKPKDNQRKNPETYEITEEVVAAISAALLCTLEKEQDQLKISSIRRI